MLRSGNPTLREDIFTSRAGTTNDVMTIQGTVNKSLILLVLLVFSAGYTWHEGASSDENLMRVMELVTPLVIGTFVIALITVFKKQWSPFLAPIYAIAEGLVLGAISLVMELKYPGIVVQAVGLTACTFFSLLIAYKSRMIKATENFKLGLAAATGGVFLIYLLGFILGFFGIRIPYIHESGLIGIGFSAVVVVIAALNLVMDFDFIESGAEQGAPKYMEWYGAFGLLVTLVWLYLEILRLLAKLRER
jgi:uncharacterized YccA/Bax inhibitor family protein